VITRRALDARDHREARGRPCLETPVDDVLNSDTSRRAIIAGGEDCEGARNGGVAPWHHSYMGGSRVGPDDRRCNEPPQIFLCYAHADTKWANRFVRCLRPLEPTAQLKIWFDTNGIRTGDQWEPKVREAIQRSDVALMLVSQDFLNSSCIMEKELPALRRTGVRLAPVLISHCLWRRVLPDWQELEWLDEHEREGPLSLVADKHGERDRRIARMCDKLLDEMLPAVADQPSVRALLGDLAEYDGGDRWRRTVPDEAEPRLDVRHSILPRHDPTRPFRGALFARRATLVPKGVQLLRPAYEKRCRIEPVVAELAARHADHSHQASLVRCNEIMARSAGNSEIYLHADVQFHRTLYWACGCERLGEFDQMVAHILDCRTHQGLMPQTPVKVSQRSHEDILRAVLNRDSIGANQAARAITDEALLAVFGRPGLRFLRLLRRSSRLGR
jgi:hypothetical protein